MGGGTTKESLTPSLVWRQKRFVKNERNKLELNGKLLRYYQVYIKGKCIALCKGEDQVGVVRGAEK